ncbi:MAG TPA: hypothetical protein VFQ61_13860 [Polyangiaceae bacterium]|nr:hypothetical protein [Polyangiaceae bacterium]
MNRISEIAFHGRFRMCVHRLLPTGAQLRLALYWACVFVLGAAWAARCVWAHAQEGVLAVGHELLGLAELTSRAEAIELNGVHVRHASLVTSNSVSATLDRFESHCLARPGVLAELSQWLTRSEPKRDSGVESHRTWRNGVWREDAGASGFVVCFVGKGAGFGGRGFAVTTVLSQFVANPDLATFGHLRYFYAERVPTGTRAVTLWTDDPVNVRRMFPGDQDASGSDSRWVPRPPNALRLLSAAAEALPLAVRIYDSAERAQVVQDFYERWAQPRGLRRVTRGANSTSYLSENGAQLLVATHEHDARTTVTLSELAAGELLSAAFEAQRSSAEGTRK